MKIEELKPLKNRLLIQLTREEQYTKSGLIFVEDELDLIRQFIRKAKVICAGPESKLYKVGDIVARRRHTGKEISIQGIDYILIREEEIEGKF
jgi:chaperonin GroES